MSERHKHEKKKDKYKMLKPHVAAEMSGNEALTTDDGKGIDQTLLEKRLEGLRDTQESVQGLSLWCQANKRHSSAIIETWLKILRKSPVEKRLTLFYLSNDVVQHARRKNDVAVMNQWAFAVQKATPLVRVPSSVSSAIARIFKIWEERNVYSKETTADLLALLNNVPAKERASEKKKPETYTAPSEKIAAFQPNTLISKIKLAFRLKSHLGSTFRAKPYVHMDMESLKASIKDRAHGMEVVQELGQLVEQIKASEAKLLSEVEERRKIVETAEIGIVYYENVRGEAKIVNSAYKNFTERVLSTLDKVKEKIQSFDEMEMDVSPVPSPPTAAPSPPPDEDDFGIRPADSVGTSSDWSSNPISVVSSNNIRSDIMNAIKTVIPSTTSDNQNNQNSYTPSTQNQQHNYDSTSYGSSISTVSTMNSQQANSTGLSSMTQYDPTMPGASMPSLAAMQQQFQQSWGGNQANDFAAMSAMIQQMLPASNNYLQGYASAQGYETYQPQPPLPADLSSIPLPPSSDPPLPPAPPQDNSHNIQDMSQNPYLQQSAVDTIENEYVPYYKPMHDTSHGMNYNEYEPTNVYTPSTPGTTNTSGPQSGRYHPYRNRRSSETNSQAGNNNDRQPPMLNSPNYAKSNANKSNIDSRFPNNTNLTPTSSEKLPSLLSFDPMEMFQSALSNKSRNNSTSLESPSPTGPTPLMGIHPSINNRSISTDSSPSSSQNQSFSDNSFYGGTGLYENFDDPDHSIGMNGDGVEPYTPRQPGMGFHKLGGGGGNLGRGMTPGTPRGIFQNNRGPRGNRGVGRGTPSRGGFGGFRGRGRGGPPRGGRGQLF